MSLEVIVLPLERETPKISSSSILRGSSNSNHRGSSSSNHRGILLSSRRKSVVEENEMVKHIR